MKMEVTCAQSLFTVMHTSDGKVRDGLLNVRLQLIASRSLGYLLRSRHLTLGSGGTFRPRLALAVLVGSPAATWSQTPPDMKTHRYSRPGRHTRSRSSRRPSTGD